MSQTSTYTLTGMTCGHCVSSATEELQEIPLVESVDVVLEAGAVSVTSAGPSTPPPSGPPSKRPATSSHDQLLSP